MIPQRVLLLAACLKEVAGPSLAFLWVRERAFSSEGKSLVLWKLKALDWLIPKAGPGIWGSEEWLRKLLSTRSGLWVHTPFPSPCGFRRHA